MNLSLGEPKGLEMAWEEKELGVGSHPQKGVDQEEHESLMRTRK